MEGKRTTASPESISVRRDLDLSLQWLPLSIKYFLWRNPNIKNFVWALWGLGSRVFSRVFSFLPPFPASEPSWPRCVPWSFWGHSVDPKTPQNTKQRTLSWFRLPVSRDEKQTRRGSHWLHPTSGRTGAGTSPALSWASSQVPVTSWSLLRVTESNNHVQTLWWFRQVVCLLSVYFLKFAFNWKIIALQHCAGFCHTSTWMSHRCTHVPFLLALSFLFKCGNIHDGFP